MVYWTQFDFDQYEQTTNDYRRQHAYAPYIAAFDLESTNYPAAGLAWMYVWSFAIGDQVAYGRTWDDLREFAANVKAALHINYHHKLVVYVHNLKFDFGFFRSELPIDGKILAKSKHEIVCCTVCDCMEYRDSYNYTEMALSRMGEEIGLSKLTGYDYAKIRHAKTPLTDSELAYISRDVEVLVKYYTAEAKRYGDPGRIPYTATQRVKKILYAHESASGGKSLKSMVSARQLDHKKPEDQKILKKLRTAFFGGYNYCTIACKNQVIPDVDDWDANSHYIAQILLHKYPLTRFAPLPTPRTVEQLEDMRRKRGPYRNKALLITLSYRDLESKLPDVAFLPIYAKNYHMIDLTDRRSMRAQKLLRSDAGTMTLTDIDFELLCKYYSNSTKIVILEVLGSDMGYLPDYITDTCVDLYAKKSAAKSKLHAIRQQRVPTAAEEAEYNRIKAYLNRIYGIFVQDPIRAAYICINGSVEIDKDKRITSTQTRYSPVLYQWGVWVAAWARYELLSLFWALCLDMPHDITTYNYQILYCDTDSIKGYGLDTDKIQAYNSTIRREVEDYCRRRRLDPQTLAGLGEFEREHYVAFKTTGIKQYCFATDNGDFVYRVSGLARPRVDDDGREVSYFSQFCTIADKFAAFDADMIIPPEQTGLMQTIFGGRRDAITVEDYTGIQDTITVNSFVLLTPKGFGMSETIEDYLEGADRDRIILIDQKFFARSGGAP